MNDAILFACVALGAAPVGAACARLLLRRCECGYYHWRWDR